MPAPLWKPLWKGPITSWSGASGIGDWSLRSVSAPHPRQGLVRNSCYTIAIPQYVGFLYLTGSRACLGEAIRVTPSALTDGGASFNGRFFWGECAVQLLRQFLDWLAVRDYDAAKRGAAAETAARYTRGNVAVQNGWFIDEDGLRDLSVQADEDMKAIEKRMPHN